MSKRVRVTTPDGSTLWVGISGVSGHDGRDVKLTFEGDPDKFHVVREELLEGQR